VTRVLDAVKAVALLVVVVAHCLAWDVSTAGPAGDDVFPAGPEVIGFGRTTGRPPQRLRFDRGRRQTRP